MTLFFFKNISISVLHSGIRLVWLTILFIATAVAADSVSWQTKDEILKRIYPPKFPERTFSILDFGAKPDGKTDCTNAFSKAIEECNKKGGGKVVVPAGTFLTGAIRLKSNVNLHVMRDAVVKFSTDPKKYLPVV
ncbi:MAG: glycosyl hydrolase family 28-related protein, partial [Bacteroidota bacterium]